MIFRFLQRVHFLPPGSTMQCGGRTYRGPCFLLEPPTVETVEPDLHVEEGGEYPLRADD